MLSFVNPSKTATSHTTTRRVRRLAPPPPPPPPVSKSHNDELSDALRSAREACRHVMDSECLLALSSIDKALARQLGAA